MLFLPEPPADRRGPPGETPWTAGGPRTTFWETLVCSVGSVIIGECRILCS
jgi:hypothetical protein